MSRSGCGEIIGCGGCETVMAGYALGGLYYGMYIGSTVYPRSRLTADTLENNIGE